MCANKFFEKKGNNMITFSFEVTDGTAYVHCSENHEERKRLKTLSLEVNAICKKTDKTGLWIVCEYDSGVQVVLITSLNKRIPLKEVELEAIKKSLIDTISSQSPGIQ